MSDKGIKAGKKNKTPLIVLGAVCILAIIGAVIYLVLDGMGIINKNDGKEDTVKKVLKVGDYKSFSYDEYVFEVTDEDVMEQYEYEIESAKQYFQALGQKFYEKVDERDGTTVQDGDTINIDYTGYIDGEAFKNGADTGFDLTIGSGQFIPGFEDSLIGATVGETVDINVTFPDEYKPNPDMSGVETVFTVKINYVGKEVEITKENAYSLLFGADSLDECLNEMIRPELEKWEATNGSELYYAEMQQVYFDEVIENSEFVDLTQEANEYADRIMDMLKTSAESYGYELGEYLKLAYGYETVDSYTSALKESCLLEKKRDYLVNEIAALENITMSDKDYEEIALTVIANYGSSDVASYQAGYDEQNGEGTFHQYMFDIYVIDVLFDKYATKIPAVATGGDATATGSTATGN